MEGSLSRPLSGALLKLLRAPLTLRASLKGLLTTPLKGLLSRALKLTLLRTPWRLLARTRRNRH